MSETLPAGLASAAAAIADDADAERRFGGLRRLYGSLGAQRIFDAHVLLVGIGGVGSWVAEALARSGLGRLTLVDMDHIAESNINRQVHALTPTLGQAKVDAMRERIRHIHPLLSVHTIDDFVTRENWHDLLRSACQHAPVDAVVDACDQAGAKEVMAAWSLGSGTHLLSVGAAGGKTQAQMVEVADLADVTHDPLLARLRYQLRKGYAAPRQGRIGVSCVFSREAVQRPEAGCMLPGDARLNCQGYGSSVAVTATFGMVAAGRILNTLARLGPVEPQKAARSPERGGLES